MNNLTILIQIIVGAVLIYILFYWHDKRLISNITKDNETKIQDEAEKKSKQIAEWKLQSEMEKEEELSKKLYFQLRFSNQSNKRHTFQIVKTMSRAVKEIDNEADIKIYVTEKERSNLQTAYNFISVMPFSGIKEVEKQLISLGKKYGYDSTKYTVNEHTGEIIRMQRKCTTAYIDEQTEILEKRIEELENLMLKKINKEE